MNKSVKIFLEILSMVGLGVWAFGVFLGVHYLTTCSFEVSVTCGLLAGLAMAFFLFLAKKYARPKDEGMHAGAAKMKKIIFISLYGVVALATSWLVIHAVACSTTLREQVREQALAQLDEVILMANPNGGSGSYLDYVAEEVRRYKDLNPRNSVDKTLGVEAADLEKLLRYDYDATATEMNEFWKKADYAVRNWNPFTVADYVVRLNSLKPQWEKKLTESSRAAVKGDFASTHEDFMPHTTAQISKAEVLTTVTSASITFLSVVIVIVLQIFILLSFLNICRSEKDGPRGVDVNKYGGAVWNG